jgi:hypothetical protein
MIGTHDNLQGKRIRIEAKERLEPWAVRVIDLETGLDIENVTRIEIDLSVYGSENKARLTLYVPAKITRRRDRGHTERVDVRDIECDAIAVVEHADA